MYVSNISLDLAESELQARVIVRKGDSDTVTVWISVHNNGEPVNIEGYDAAIYYTRKSRRQFVTECVVEHNRVRYDVSAGLMSIAGRVECELRLTRGGNVLSSPRFAITVEDTVYTGVTADEAERDDVLAAVVAKLADIEDGAEANAIEGVKVNGTALTPDADRAVDITVPTTAEDIGAAEAVHGHTMSDITDGHGHVNKAALDKLAESADGQLLYDGEAVGSGSGGGHIVVDTFDDLPAEAEYGARATVRESQLLEIEVTYDELAINTAVPSGFDATDQTLSVFRHRDPITGNADGYVYLIMLHDAGQTANDDFFRAIVLIYLDVVYDANGDDTMVVNKTLGWASDDEADGIITAGWNRLKTTNGEEFESIQAAFSAVGGGNFSSAPTSAPTNLMGYEVADMVMFDPLTVSQIINAPGVSGRDRGEYMYNGTRWVRLNGGLDVRTDYRFTNEVVVHLISNCSYSFLLISGASDIQFNLHAPDEPDIENTINITLSQAGYQNEPAYIRWTGSTDPGFATDNPYVTDSGESEGYGEFTIEMRWSKTRKKWYVFTREYRGS